MSAIVEKAAKAALKGLLKLVKKELNKPPRQLGEWLGEYRIQPPEDDKRSTFHQSPTDPLRLLVYGDVRLEYMLSGKYPTDFGSIPKLIQKLGKNIKMLKLAPRDFERAYLHHDGLYRFAGVYVRPVGEIEWTWVSITRAEADALLYIGLTAEKATRAQSQVIYRGVLIGAGRAWRIHRKSERDVS